MLDAADCVLRNVHPYGAPDLQAGVSPRLGENPLMRDQLLDLFLRLVAVPSQSGNEGAVAATVSAYLRDELGLTPEQDEAHRDSPAGCGNVLALLPATAPDRPTLLLNAHLDTVGHTTPIVPLVEGDVVRSQGDTILGADDKAGVALILLAARRLLKAQLPHGDLWLVFTMAEEVGLWGARRLDYARLHPWPELGYVLDGGREPGRMVIGAPAIASLDVTITGRAAHAGVCPEQGVNAVAVAAQAIAGMQLGRLDEETTANVGLIAGGSARNIVPELCKFQAEARSYVEAKLDRQVQHMRAAITAAAEAAGAHAQIEETRPHSAFVLSPDAPVVRRGWEAAERAGLSPTTARGGGASDANIFNEHGIPSLMLATGAANVHTPEEELRLEVMAGSLRWLVEIITSNK